MYIIGKRKDFYDGVVGTMGIDKTIIYEREIKILENEKEFPKEFRPVRYVWRKRGMSLLSVTTNMYHCHKESKYTNFSSFIIGFCGKLYVGWKLYREEKKPFSTDLVTDITYDIDFLKEHVNEKGWGSNLNDDIKYVETYDPIEIFRLLNIPIFIYDSDYERTSIGTYRHRKKSVFIINPNLSDYRFYTVINSFTAFQEIQMFLGGVLGKGEKKITEVEDKYKISQHGFDKWSFRKEPEKK
jgi:hypothetical protein